MPKLTNEEKQNFEEKLKYLGLDLENIPSFLKEFEGLEYRPSKQVDDKEYVVYRYIPVNEIQILITPTNRLTEIKEKYEKAKPIAQYLNPEETEESLERFAAFLNMLRQTEVQEIEEVAKKQASLQKEIPFRIKYEKNYLWQIYYSASSKKYFMLVPSDDVQFGSFFYLLKKQIEYYKNPKKQPERIYVPIVMERHDGSILKRSQMKDIENYLWLFTKHWPVLYELTNKQNEMSIEIVGQTDLEEKLNACYKISLKNENEATMFYKQVKALFILQTEASDYYNFKPAINKEGNLEFHFEGENVNYQNLSIFMKNQYLKIAEKKAENENKMTALEAKLEALKLEADKMDKDYLNKQKEITTYLEYKKTFLGRVKYFFSKKKNKNNNNEESKKQVTEETSMQAMPIEAKAFYTIEDLVSICHMYSNETTKTKNLELDVKALEEKTRKMAKKIENATLYLNEIDSHKKSIFEFWRFTSKDDNLGLNAGEEPEEVKPHVLRRVFEYESDIEDVGKQMDKKNQEVLSKDELDALFIAKTQLLDIINKIRNHVMVPDSTLNKILRELKKEAEQKKALFKTEEHDIFGALVEDRTQIKLLNGKKHREAEKDKFQILNITKDTTLPELKEALKKIEEDVESAGQKGKLLTDMTIYLAQESEKKLEQYAYAWYHMKAEEALRQANFKSEEIALIKINVLEQMPAIYDTNSLYFDNYNKTLPLGMDLSDKILLDGDKFIWTLQNESEFYTNSYFEEETDEATLQAKKIHLYEYDLSLKEKRKV